VKFNGSAPTANYKQGSEGKLNMLMSITSTGFTPELD